MSPRFDPAITRGRFVQFLAGSPLLTHPGVPALAQSTSTPSRLADPMVWAPPALDNLISDPKETLDVVRLRAGREEESAAGEFRVHGHWN